MKGRDRNAPCWCGSRKKYKKCHLGRDGQSRENPWAAVDINRQAFSKKKCCAHDVGLGTCDGGVIKAHTVSRGPNLTRIAKNGHVMQYGIILKDFKQNNGKISCKSVGIRDASVFYGFCKKHDKELFSCIENKTFNGHPDQCLAVAYRTMSRELYGKDAGAHMRETLRGADKGMKLFEQIMLQTMLNDISTGNEAAQREMRATHDALTVAMTKGQYDVICSFVLEFSGQLPFMFAGAWSPFFDLYGNELQSERLNGFLEQIIVSSFATEYNAMICISWRNIQGAPGKVIAEQINALPRDQQASGCLQFVTKHVENIFFNPDWIQGLAEKQKEQLDSLAADGVDLMGSVPSRPIRADMDFQVPAASRYFCV